MIDNKNLPITVKRRHASIQTVNDMLTDEAPEYAARCPSLRKKELFYLPNLFTEIDERAIQVGRGTNKPISFINQLVLNKRINQLKAIPAYLIDLHKNNDKLA